jgi:uncharacterized membrane protein
MAGIGFELKKLFSGNSILLKLRANLFSGIVIAGPMIMGEPSSWLELKLWQSTLTPLYINRICS